MKNQIRLPRCESGFTLIELLIGETIALLVISGLLTFLGPATAGLADARSNSDIQDSGRAGYQLLDNAIEYAGYQGCSSDTTHTSILASLPPAASPRLRNWAYQSFGVRGFDAAEDDRVTEQLGSTWRNQRYRYQGISIGDIIILQTAKGKVLSLAGHNPEQYKLIFDGRKTDQLQAGQILQINDCSHSARLQIDPSAPPSYSTLSDKTTVFYTPESTLNCGTGQVASISLGPGTQGGCHGADAVLPLLPYSFEVGTRVHVVDSAAYFIGEDTATGGPALKRSGFASNAARVYTETLVTGVENFRVRYGMDLDADGSPDQYAAASEIALRDDDSISWDNVVSVALWLLVRSTGKSEHAETAASVVFPAVDGSKVSCNTRAPLGTDNYISHLLACPFPSQSRRQYDRYVVAGIVNLRNTNL